MIRLPACARVSRVSRVCPGSPRCLFTAPPAVTHLPRAPSFRRPPSSRRGEALWERVEAGSGSPGAKVRKCHDGAWTPSRKRHRGEPGHTRDTRDTRAHAGTRITRTNLTTIHPNPSGTVPVQRHGGSRDTPKTEQYSSSFSTPSTGSVRFRDATWASGVAL